MTPPGDPSTGSLTEQPHGAGWAPCPAAAGAGTGAPGAAKGEAVAAGGQTAQDRIRPPARGEPAQGSAPKAGELRGSPHYSTTPAFPAPRSLRTASPWVASAPRLPAPERAAAHTSSAPRPGPISGWRLQGRNGGTGGHQPGQRVTPSRAPHTPRPALCASQPLRSQPRTHARPHRPAAVRGASPGPTGPTPGPVQHPAGSGHLLAGSADPTADSMHPGHRPGPAGLSRAQVL